MKWCDYSSLLRKRIVSVQCKPQVMFVQREKQKEKWGVMIMAVLKGIWKFSLQLWCIGKNKLIFHRACCNGISFFFWPPKWMFQAYVAAWLTQWNINLLVEVFLNRCWQPKNYKPVLSEISVTFFMVQYLHSLQVSYPPWLVHNGRTLSWNCLNERERRAPMIFLWEEEIPILWNYSSFPYDGPDYKNPFL